MSRRVEVRDGKRMVVENSAARPDTWNPVMELGEKEVYTGDWKLATDCKGFAIKKETAKGVHVEIGGVKHGIPLAVAKELHTLLGDLIAEAEA